jgi:hypothetical protein
LQVLLRDKPLKATGHQLQPLIEQFEELLKKHGAPAETSRSLVSNQQPVSSAQRYRHQ